MNEIAIEAYRDYIEVWIGGEYCHKIERDKRDTYEDIPVIFYDMLPELLEKLGFKTVICWDYKNMG